MKKKRERERENKELEVQQEILTKTKLKKVSGLYSKCKLLFYDVDEINWFNFVSDLERNY